MQLLELATGMWIWQGRTGEFAHAMTFSPDGTRLALADARSVRLFEGSTGKEIVTWEVHPKHHLNCLCFSPDGCLLATGGNDRLVRFWRMEGLADGTPAQVAAYDWGVGKVRSVAFAPDGMTAAAVGDNRKVVLWDVVET